MVLEENTGEWEFSAAGRQRKMAVDETGERMGPKCRSNVLDGEE